MTHMRCRAHERELCRFKEGCKGRSVTCLVLPIDHPLVALYNSTHQPTCAPCADENEVALTAQQAAWRARQ